MEYIALIWDMLLGWVWKYARVRSGCQATESPPQIVS